MFDRLKRRVLVQLMESALSDIERHLPDCEIRRRAAVPTDGTIDPATPVTYEIQARGRRMLYNPKPGLEVESAKALGLGAVVTDPALRHAIVRGLGRETRAAFADPMLTPEVSASGGVGYRAPGRENRVR
jgi:hypothetical protein